jgi:hypothetical protein
MLSHMLKDGQVERYREHASESYLYSLPGVYAMTKYANRQHEIDCGDVFVALVNTEKLQYWDAIWQEDEKSIKTDYRVWYDRRFQFDDKLFFLEVDRGTEDLEAFEAKIKKYLKLAQDSNTKWYVLITIQGYRQSAPKRAQNIAGVLEHLNVAPFHYLIGFHDVVLTDALGKVWSTWKRPLDQLSLTDLDS